MAEIYKANGTREIGLTARCALKPGAKCTRKGVCKDVDRDEKGFYICPKLVLTKAIKCRK
jgi:hypothetical protein